MAHRPTTGGGVASKAGGLLRSKSTSSKVKSVAGSALSQKHGKRSKR